MESINRHNSNPTRILRLDASANPAGSSSIGLGDHLQSRLQSLYPQVEIQRRNLNQELPFIDSDWIAANFTDAQDRGSEQAEKLELSDRLIDELKWADHIVLTTPMYNFGIPATLKAWIDQVCRAGSTFLYTADGPEGLLDGKRLDIVITTGGAPLDSPVDFVSGYLKQVFSFIGIDDVRIFGADRMNIDADANFAAAIAQIDDNYADTASREVA